MANEAVSAQLNRLDPERIKGYKELLDFYNGRQWEGRERRGERRLIFNYARVFVEKITSYLMTGISFAVDPFEDSEEARARARKAEAALYKVYADNQLEQLDLETEIDCAVLGDGCYKVTWDAAEKSVRVTAPDIQGIYTWCSGDDVSRVWRIASRYRLSAEEVELIYGVKPQKKTAIIVEIWTDRDFELYLDNALLEAKPNPYGFLPFIVFPNLREPKKFWGISDLPQIMESQRELNRAMSQLSRILELSGNPIAVLENVEESEDIAIKPGAVWNIPEDAKAYLLDLLQGGDNQLRVVWGPVLPKDMERKVGSEQVMVQTGIHSRRTAMNEVGVRDPDCEFERWLEERESILKMNKELNAKSGRGGAREGDVPSRVEGVEE